MKISDLRTRLGLTQEQFAAELGLANKSSVSELERSGKCSVRVALEIERLSGGEIPADSLHPDVDLVRRSSPEHRA